MALVLLFVLLVPVVVAQEGEETFVEDFEGFDLTGFSPEIKPDQVWYNYREGADIGVVTTEEPVIEGSQSFRVRAPATSGDIAENRATFVLSRPTQLEAVEFFVEGVDGSTQFIGIQSSSPVRKMVEFFLMCNVSGADGCEFRVRFAAADSIGQVLIPASENKTQFKVRVEPDYLGLQYQLFVDDVDDGTFPFLQLPRNIGRVQIGQQSGLFPVDVAFDLWRVEGALEGAAAEIEGDAATGIRNFATDIRFTAPSSLFLLGLVFMVIMMAAVVVPLVTVGKSQAVVPATGSLAILISFWLIDLGFWPQWIGITMIILVAALVALMVRRLILGVRNASGGAALVAGSLGYFIIASSFLAFSGYAEFDIELPTDPAQIEVDELEGATEEQIFKQTYVEAIFDCSVAIVTFGFGGNCVRDERGTVTEFLAETVDNVGRFMATVFNFARVAFRYLFQLLTFQLPIPIIFNIMIVLPPATALATEGLKLIRGSGS